MLRSLYAGVSGMKSNQTKMDVIGNNISNVNTTGFKTGRVSFKDLFSQTISSAQGSTSSTGGINAMQVGLGVSLATIGNIMTGGSIQSTGRDLDVAIEGQGFLVVSPDSGSTILYTRDGTLNTDRQGNLVTASGMKVQGFLPSTVSQDPTDISNTIRGNLLVPQTIGSHKLEEVSIDGNGYVKGIYNGEIYYIGRIALAKFSNPEGLEKMGNNTYAKSSNSGEPSYGSSGVDGMGRIRTGCLEMANVDLATEFTEMIITSRAYSANSKIITTSDEMLQELIGLKR
ncbi:MAG: flagellar hook-basal body complex protein [Peptostreptococcales bacterium]|jgi:flagellar hook protein FlgE